MYLHIYFGKSVYWEKKFGKNILGKTSFGKKGYWEKRIGSNGAPPSGSIEMLTVCESEG